MPGLRAINYGHIFNLVLLIGRSVLDFKSKIKWIQNVSFYSDLENFLRANINVKQMPDSLAGDGSKMETKTPNNKTTKSSQNLSKISQFYL